MKTLVVFLIVLAAGYCAQQFRAMNSGGGVRSEELGPSANQVAMESAIEAHELIIGMTDEQVLRSWGSPQKVNQTVTKRGNHDQWCYGTRERDFLYFDNGVLSTMQVSNGNHRPRATPAPTPVPKQGDWMYQKRYGNLPNH